MKAQQILIKGKRIEYVKVGSGPALLLLHGALASFRIYGKLIEILSKYFTVYAPTLPGMGQSESFGAETSFALYVEIITEFIKLMGITPIFLGHSLGGAVLSAVAARNPGITPFLILIDSAGIPYENFMKSTVGGWVGGFFEYQYWTKSGKLIDRIMPWDMRNMMLRPIESNRVGKVLRSIDLRSEFPLITAKTLILWGENDTHFPFRFGQRIEELIPGAKLTMIAHAEHNWLLYQVDEVVRYILDFINK